MKKYRFKKDTIHQLKEKKLPQDYINGIKILKKRGEKTEQEIRAYFKAKLKKDDPGFENNINLILATAVENNLDISENNLDYFILGPETRSIQFEYIEEKYYKLFELIEIDPCSTALAARTLGETIIKQIVINEKSRSTNPKEFPGIKDAGLNNLTKFLKKRQFINKYVNDAINIVRCYGNKAAHETATEENLPKKEITYGFAINCIANVSIVLEWYLSEYLTKNYDKKVNYDFDKLLNEIKNVKISYPVENYGKKISAKKQIRVYVSEVLAVLLISFFTVYYFYPGKKPESDQSPDKSLAAYSSKTGSHEINPAEAAVDEIKNKITRLYSIFESIDDYGEHALNEVREKAPVFARNLLNLDETGMDLKHMILKYQFANFSFSMAAWVEPAEKERNAYTDMAVNTGYKSLALIREAEKKAASGKKQDSELAEWIVSRYKKEVVHYLLAVSFAIKARNGDESALKKVSHHLDAIPSAYKERYPLEKEPNLKWFLETQNLKGKQ